MKEKIMGIAVGLLALLFMPMSAPAVTWNVMDGILMGANDVIVNGQLYDVEFIDGTCNSVFSVCDSTSAFAFQTWEAAHTAALALFDQVLINVVSQGMFDDSPQLTNGISDQYHELLIIPFSAGGGSVNMAIAYHWAAWLQVSDWITIESWDASYLHTEWDDDKTWAKFQRVPEPPTFVLLACGLAGLVFARRQGKRQEGLTL